MATTIVIDAGHGGADPGATYEGRQEKDDALRLALLVGDYLERAGVNVVYTRESDIYETPFKKATDGNEANADFFISIHRNSSVRPGAYDGFETLVFDDSGIKAAMARNINANMEQLGFKNNGVTERPNLVVLKRTQMPALLLEAGFINSEKDNAIFDNNFDAMARGIADGILDTIRGTQSAYSENSISDGNNTDGNNFENDASAISNEGTGAGVRQLYRVQVGAYRNRSNADRMLNSLLMEGFPAFIIYDDGYYKVQVGAYELLANAVAMENRLRNFRYNTYITT